LRLGAVAVVLLTVIGVGGCRALDPQHTSATDPASSGQAGDGGGATGASNPRPSSTSGRAGSSEGGGPLGIPGSWQLVFDDEFDGFGLDTTRWSTGWMGAGITSAVNTLEPVCYDPAQVAVANGNLFLSVVQKEESCGGVTQPYAAGAVTTDGKASFLFGAFEARVYLPSAHQGVANWPSWWADGHHWPEDGEMDIAEGLGGRVCYHLRYTTTYSAGGCPDGDFTGWHTYAADWEPGSVSYYYDGVKVGTITNSGITPAPQFLILDYSVYRDSTLTAAPLTMRVDYVRVWQH
jgi:beta-glucanase (GH16 family)